MRLLLDTHVFLWWLSDDPKLGARERAIIVDGLSLVHVSAASFWEISIKAALGRIDVGDTDLVGEVEANDFVELPITARHVLAAGALPRHHDDPFDRMLIAQAEAEALTIVTRDRAFRLYNISLFAT